MRAFDISGNTAIASSVLLRIAAPFTGRAIKDVELQELLRRLTDVYVQAGFSTSRATVPDQDIVDDVIRIAIVEGFLERIEVSGAPHVDSGYIAERLQVGITKPLNLAILNANLQMLKQGLGSIRAELSPGIRPGGSILHAVIDEAARFEGGLRLANDRAPAVGGIRGAIEASAHNLFGRGDVIDLVFGTADGLKDLDFRLTSPVSSHGTEISFRYFNATSKLVEEQFAILGAETQSTGIEFGVSQAVLHTPARAVDINAKVASRVSESLLAGRPFSFSPGVDNGKADVKAVRLGAQWIERHLHDYLSARVTYSIGIDGLGATSHDDGRPDSSFQSALGQIQYLHTFGPRTGAVFARADLQFALDSLLPLEKFAVGGTYSVRGYRRARFVRDSGWSGSLEYRLPLLPFVFSHAIPERLGTLAIVGFVDAGRAWNDDGEDRSPTLIAAGPGLRWDFNHLRAEVYWGGLRRRLESRGDDLQDDGVHFVLNARSSF